jgi:hypothetical protein
VCDGKDAQLFNLTVAVARLRQEYAVVGVPKNRPVALMSKRCEISETAA